MHKCGSCKSVRAKVSADEALELGIAGEVAHIQRDEKTIIQ